MDKRAALINYLNKLKSAFPRHFEDLDINSVEIYADIHDRNERKEIFKILSENKNTLALVARVILEHRFDNSFYRKEPHGTTAMKFKTKLLNSRIYCLEFKEPEKTKKIVMVIGVRNKQESEIKKSIKARLKSISNYQYKFFIDPKHAVKHREKK